MNRLFAILLMAASLFTASMASAQFGPDTLVGGDVKIDVEVEDVETTAGFLSQAETDIGTINSGAYVFGRVDIDVEAEDVETNAGFLSKACTSIGSIGGCKNQGGL